LDLIKDIILINNSKELNKALKEVLLNNILAKLRAEDTRILIDINAL